jgi:hypothetical protein
MEHLDIVLSLQKSLYGTVTAPKQFYEHLKIGMENKVLLLQVNLTLAYSSTMRITSWCSRMWMTRSGQEKTYPR